MKTSIRGVRHTLRRRPSASQAFVLSSRYDRCRARCEPSQKTTSPNIVGPELAIHDVLPKQKWDTSDEDASDAAEAKRPKRRKALRVLRARTGARTKRNYIYYLHVVAAAVYDEVDGTVLLAQRPQGKRYSGLWEFPGGKVEPGELPEAALVRELREEVNLEIREEDLEQGTFWSVSPSWSKGKLRRDRVCLVMLLYVCRTFSGVAAGMEGQNIEWVKLSDLHLRTNLNEGASTFVPWLQSYLRSTTLLQRPQMPSDGASG